MSESALQSLHLLERHYSHEAVAPPEADPPTDEETAGVPRPGLKVSRKTLFVIGGSGITRS